MPAPTRLPLPLLSFLLLIVTALLSLLLGRYAISSLELLHFLTTLCGVGDMPADRYQLIHSLLIDARAPRMFAGMLIGAGLSVSGAAYQAVFRNPLVSPGLLGVLSGCAFGAALGIICQWQALPIAVLSCVTGLIAVAVGVGIAHLFQTTSILLLVLGGIVANALFTSLLSITQYLADPVDQLPSIVYWLLGSLSAVDRSTLLIIGPVLTVAIVLLCLAGRAIDALSLSDDEALSLGVTVQRIRYGVIVLATLICALTVSLAGMVGWIGLLVPHLARLLVGRATRDCYRSAPVWEVPFCWRRMASRAVYRRVKFRWDSSPNCSVPSPSCWCCIACAGAGYDVVAGRRAGLSHWRAADSRRHLGQRELRRQHRIAGRQWRGQEYLAAYPAGSLGACIRAGLFTRATLEGAEPADHRPAAGLRAAKPYAGVSLQRFPHRRARPAAQYRSDERPEPHR